MSDLTASNLINATIAIHCFDSDPEKLGKFLSDYSDGLSVDSLKSGSGIDSIKEFIQEAEYNQEIQEYFCWQDSEAEVRYSGTDTGMGAPSSRHYECEHKAMQVFGGQWVGFNFWHGGGKHGEPEGIDWIPDAELLDVEEEEVTIIQRTFSKKGGE